MQRSILNLDALVKALPTETRQLFHAIFTFEKNTGTLAPPPEMHPWIVEKFGSLDAVTSQTIIRVENLLTCEGTLFNQLRAKRPLETHTDSDIEQKLHKKDHCDFCQPLQFTPADTFGRIQGSHSLTASNLAKYDACHGLVIFDQHYPFVFDPEHITDFLHTALQWIDSTHQAHQDALFPLIAWNCAWRAGASIPHGHLQTLLAKSPYPRIALLNQAAQRYQQKHHQNYWQALARIHDALGLSLPCQNLHAFSSLTPIKEKEIMLIGSRIDDALSATLAQLLRAYYEIGVRAFNLVIISPPLRPIETWKDFPLIVRLVDRGDLHTNASDIGAMELYACSVVASDPFQLSSTLTQHLTRPS